MTGACLSENNKWLAKYDKRRLAGAGHNTSQEISIDFTAIDQTRTA